MITLTGGPANDTCDNDFLPSTGMTRIACPVQFFIVVLHARLDAEFARLANSHNPSLSACNVGRPFDEGRAHNGHSSLWYEDCIKTCKELFRVFD